MKHNDQSEYCEPVSHADELKGILLSYAANPIRLKRTMEMIEKLFAIKYGEEIR